MAPKVVVGGGHKYKPETSWIARLSRATRVLHKTYVARGIALEQLEVTLGCQRWSKGVGVFPIFSHFACSWPGSRDIISDKRASIECSFTCLPLCDPMTMDFATRGHNVQSPVLYHGTHADSSHLAY
jgi:hypothetical protein